MCSSDLQAQAVLGAGFPLQASASYLHEHLDGGGHWVITPADVLPEVARVVQSTVLSYTHPLDDTYSLIGNIQNSYTGPRYSIAFPVVGGAFAGNGACIAVVHRSLWQEMLVLGYRAATPATPDTTFGTLLALTPDGETRSFETLVTDSIAWVGAERSLADAKAAMESKAGCLDVMVTASGSPKEPVAGWLTKIGRAHV